MRQSRKMKHDTVVMAGDFLGCDYFVWSFSSVETRFSDIPGLKSMLFLLSMLSSDLVKEFCEDWFVFTVESNMIEIDSAHDILGLLSYHHIQVQIVDMYVCEPDLRVKIKEGVQS